MRLPRLMPPLDPLSQTYWGERPTCFRCTALGRSWHFCDIATSRMNFRFRWKRGRAAAITTMTEVGPEAVMGRFHILQCSDRPPWIPKQDSEQFRFVPRTLRPHSETLLLRPSRVITFEPMGEKHGSSPGLFERRTLVLLRRGTAHGGLRARRGQPQSAR